MSGYGPARGGPAPIWKLRHRGLRVRRFVAPRNANANAATDAYTHAHADANTHADAHAYTHIVADARIDGDTFADAHTHAYTHVHTHTVADARTGGADPNLNDHAHTVGHTVAHELATRGNADAGGLAGRSHVGRRRLR